MLYSTSLSILVHLEVSLTLLSRPYYPSSPCVHRTAAKVTQSCQPKPRKSLLAQTPLWVQLHTAATGQDGETKLRRKQTGKNKRPWSQARWLRRVMATEPFILKSWQLE